MEYIVKSIHTKKTSLPSRVLFVVVINSFHGRISNKYIICNSSTQSYSNTLGCTDDKSLEWWSSTKTSGSASEGSRSIEPFVSVDDTFRHYFLPIDLVQMMYNLNVSMKRFINKIEGKEERATVGILCSSGQTPGSDFLDHTVLLSRRKRYSTF